MAHLLLSLVALTGCVTLSQGSGLLFTRIAKEAAESGESLCGNFTRGNTVYLEQDWEQSDGLVGGNSSNVWRGFVGLRNVTKGANVTVTLTNNCTLGNGTTLNCSQCMLMVINANKTIQHKGCNKVVCAKRDLLAFQRENMTWIGKCVKVTAGNTTLKKVQGMRTDIFLKGTEGAGKDPAGSDCKGDTIVWDFKRGCSDWLHHGWDECGDTSWGAGNFFTFGGDSVKWITELEINSNHMQCKINKLANLTTKALEMLNKEEGDLREATIDNRLALELLLARSGGLCKYIGRQSCCTDISDFQRNVSEILEQMHKEIANYQRAPVAYGLDLGLNGLFNWMHWIQWVPIIILCVVACIFLRR